MRGQWGCELKDVNLPDLLTLFKEFFLPVRNVFHSRAQFLNMKQDENNETLDEYWKRLLDIERNCDFNSITAEEIISYKFAATIKDKKASDKFIKGPLKLQLVLETGDLDNYNRKYGEKNRKIKNPEKTQQINHQKVNRLDTPTKHENESQFCPKRRNSQTGIAAFAENQIGH